MMSLEIEIMTTQRNVQRVNVEDLTEGEVFLILQELSYLSCALPCRFIFSSETVSMTPGESEKTGAIFWGHGRLAGNSPEIARAGQKGHQMHISLTDGRRNLVYSSK